MLEASGRKSARSLPVLFLLDASKATSGTFHVIAQDGPLLVKRELEELYPAVARHVYMGEITCASKPAFHPLTSLTSFGGLEWEVQGSLMLQHALALLSETFTFDLIVPSIGHPGDYPPLLLLLIGEQPVDEWQEMFMSIMAQLPCTPPLVVSLVTLPALVKEMSNHSQLTLLLPPTDASGLTSFFFWIVQLIVKVYQAYTEGAARIPLPVLPPGIHLASYKGLSE